MRRDIREGRLLDDTLVKDFDYLRHLMGRREQLVNQIRLHQGPHRGPGTPGYRPLGRDEHVGD